MKLQKIKMRTLEAKWRDAAQRTREAGQKGLEVAHAKLYEIGDIGGASQLEHAGTNPAVIRATVKTVRDRIGIRIGIAIANEAWLEAGLEMIEHACELLEGEPAKIADLDAAHRRLSVYAAHETDGMVKVLARGGGTETEVRVYDGDPQSFEQWLEANEALEQWLVGGTATPIRLL